MKKVKILTACALVTAFTMSMLSATACDFGSKEYNAVQVDMNPSVEFIVDRNNKVVSVTALNDDGAVIISGEAFVGKTAEEAVELFVNVSAETGYILQGNAKYSKEELTVSVSGNEEAAKALYDSIATKVSETATAQQIAVTIEQGKALAVETLKKTVMACYPELTKEEVDAMTEEELLAQLAEYREETKELASAAMRQAYNDAKNYRVNLSENEAVKGVIAEASSVQSAVLETFDKALEALNEAVVTIEKTQAEQLIVPESSYQKAVTAVLEAKKEMLIQREKVEQLEDGIEKTLAQGILTAKETALTAAQTQLDIAYQAATTAFDLAKNTVNMAITSLNTMKTSFSGDLKTLLEEKVAEIDKAVNETKDGFFAEFEKAHAQSVESYNAHVAEVKKAMKERQATAE